jgi:hypothetical protein
MYLYGKLNLKKSFHSFPKKFSNIVKTSDKMNILKNVSLYKRVMPKLGVQFQTAKSQQMLQECIDQGTSISFFHLVDQYQTQGDPTYCGPITMAVLLNSLQIDPKKQWKGYL